ncbi:putative phage terminase large subunit-like protein [Bacillus thermophilus]|uniref:Phage terminase large subunit-like protein n=1 Tax=Siminovitchia thermophila TaxID=1245522 RepID=A0ABS2RBX2_9BACI|nr:phage terminase large subunit [Siminovitchia thermophila]MBM7717157.1 putative phage terminase large subunit-like protein [Siminovitchia thermophila]
MTKQERIKMGAKIELAKREFFYFCHALAPDFYKPDRKFLVDLCGSMQDFYFGDDDVLVVNVPPRHGKSRTAGLFAQWIFGKNKNEKIMTGSYNETLSTVFSKQVRNSIQEEKAHEGTIVYSDIFPTTRIQRGDAAMNLWSLEGGYNNYLATSPTGTATGFGASLIIVDDLIKNDIEAFNADVLEKHWSWFVNTMLSRLETGGKIIIIMTRWHSNDLAGRALRELPDLGYSVKHINMKAVQDDGSMLCDGILTRKEYEQKTSAMSPEVASANYQQEPIDIKGRLYSRFKTYDDLPANTVKIGSYTDTADTGSDYLASFIYAETKDKEAYILDAIYTKEPMEVTEPLLAKKLYEHKVNLARIESNNGGRGFGRSVQRILKEQYSSNKASFDFFYQNKNKEARILSNATWVMDHIYFPANWRHRWPELYKALTTYQKEGKNAHDDAPDALTGVAESIQDHTTVKLFKGGL